VVATVLIGGSPLEPAGHAVEQAPEAEPRFAEAREALGELLAETRAYAGASPSAVLTALAERQAFDAIVIGSPHRGPVGRVLIGNVGASLLNGASRDVLVAPKGYAEERHEPLRRIAVGYDGSPGSPANALVRECEDGVDLVVLGSRGYGPLARVLLGSVSRHVAQHAPCPVWVAPRPERGADEQGEQAG
jgi:nucleotide-binding universal stress UspA family protein